MLKKWLGTLNQAGKNNYRSKDLLEYDKWLKQGKFLLLHTLSKCHEVCCLK